MVLNGERRFILICVKINHLKSLYYSAMCKLCNKVTNESGRYKEGETF